METDLKPVGKVCDFRDRLVMTLVAGAGVAATLFLYLHPSDMNFASWCGFTTTTIGAYHWILYKDDKTPDNNP